jgi:hypothetical protein
MCTFSPIGAMSQNTGQHDDSIDNGSPSELTISGSLCEGLNCTSRLARSFEPVTCMARD